MKVRISATSRRDGMWGVSNEHATALIMTGLDAASFATGYNIVKSE